MSKKLRFSRPCDDATSPRIGGGALIGNIFSWPVAPDGKPLTLVMSLPTDFLNTYAGFELPTEHIISVFSYYSQGEYFLDSVTYNGFQEELDWIRKGFTKVLLHGKGSEVFDATKIPATVIDVESDDLDADVAFGGSKVGEPPTLLQAEPLSLENERFALQLYGGKFPRPHHGIFGLSDAVGYLFIAPDRAGTSTAVDAGTFFVQAT